MSGIIDKSCFVRIETLFTNQNEREISSLKKVYDQPGLLQEKIRKISKGILDNVQIISGKKILLKPNWVTHNQKRNDEICLRTNDNFLLALVEVVLECNPAKITIGDAPIQGCDWEKMLSPDFYKSIDELNNKFSIPIIIKDFRRVTFDPQKSNSEENKRSISDYIIFDLGKESDDF